MPAGNTGACSFLCWSCSKCLYPRLEWKVWVFKLLENGIWPRQGLKTLYFSWNWHKNELNADGALAWQADGTDIECWGMIYLQPWTFLWTLLWGKAWLAGGIFLCVSAQTQKCNFYYFFFNFQCVYWHIAWADLGLYIQFRSQVENRKMLLFFNLSLITYLCMLYFLSNWLNLSCWRTPGAVE